MFNYSPFLNSSLTSFNPPLNPPLNPINTMVLRGKIYKISPIDETESLNTNNIYIGSTILSLKEEMEEQISNYYRTIKKIRFESEDVFSKYGVDNCQIVLIEDFKCNSIQALCKREGEVMRKIKGIR
jgi:hypothetical protein